MLTKTKTILIVALALKGMGCGSAPSASFVLTDSVSGSTLTPSAAPYVYTHFLYSSNKTDNTVSEFGINLNDGSLKAIPGNATVSTDSQPLTLGLTPNHEFLYVICSTEIDGFSVDATSGALTPIQSIGMPPLPVQMAFSSDGSKLYVLSNGNTQQEILQYNINQNTGLLTYFNSYSTLQLNITFQPVAGVIQINNAAFNNEYYYTQWVNKIELYSRKSNGLFYDTGLGYFSGNGLDALSAF